MCRSFLHMTFLLLSLAEVNRGQQQGTFETQDSFGETINVFNLTTISPNEETATKVSAETIETILGALDSAAMTIEMAQVSTLDAQDYTTEKLPSMEDMEDEIGFTVTPDFPNGGSDSSDSSSSSANNNNSEDHKTDDINDNDANGGSSDSSSENNVSDEEEPVPATDIPDFITQPPIPGLDGSSGGDGDTPLNPGDAISGILPGRPDGGSGGPGSLVPGGGIGPGGGSVPGGGSLTTTALPSTEGTGPDDVEVIDEDTPPDDNNETVEIVAVDDGSGLNASVIETRAFDMTTYLSDLETRIVFHRLDNGICQLQCTVITRTDRLFKDENGVQLDVEYLPTIYLVDGRTDCRGLVEEGGEALVKFIGAIRFAGIVVADISEVLQFDELYNRCIAILVKKNFVAVDGTVTSSTDIVATVSTPPTPSSGGSGGSSGISASNPDSPLATQPPPGVAIEAVPDSGVIAKPLPGISDLPPVSSETEEVTVPSTGNGVATSRPPTSESGESSFDTPPTNEPDGFWSLWPGLTSEGTTTTSSTTVRPRPTTTTISAVRPGSVRTTTRPTRPTTRRTTTTTTTTPRTTRRTTSTTTTTTGNNRERMILSVENNFFGSYGKNCAFKKV